MGGTTGKEWLGLLASNTLFQQRCSNLNIYLKPWCIFLKFGRPSLKNDQLTYQEMREWITAQGSEEDLEEFCRTCQTLFNIKILQSYSASVRRQPLLCWSQGIIKRQERRYPDLPDLHYFLQGGHFPRLSHKGVWLIALLIHRNLRERSSFHLERVSSFIEIIPCRLLYLLATLGWALEHVWDLSFWSDACGA